MDDELSVALTWRAGLPVGLWDRDFHKAVRVREVRVLREKTTQLTGLRAHLRPGLEKPVENDDFRRGGSKEREHNAEFFQGDLSVQLGGEVFGED